MSTTSLLNSACGLICAAMVTGGAASASPQEKLLTAIAQFHAVREHLSAPTSAEALAAYKRALDTLQEVPGMLEEGKRYTVNLRGRDGAPEGLPGVIDLRMLLYNTQFNYAPWGLEWTRWLIEQDVLSKFDLRVIRPYGELLWVDVDILEPPGRDPAACRLGGPWVQAINAQQAILKEETVHRRVYLRIFSTRIQEDNPWDVLGESARGAELGLRWGGVFYGIATVSTGGAAGVGVPLGFALLDSGLDYLKEGPDSICVDIGHASTAANYTYTTVTAGAEAMSLYRSGEKLASLGNTTKVGIGIGLLDFATKAVQKMCERDGYTAMVREQADGNPDGYPSGFLLTGGTTTSPFPPILVHASTLGEVAPGGRYPVAPSLDYTQTDADYPVWELSPLTWQVNYSMIYPRGSRGLAIMPPDANTAAPVFAKVPASGLPAVRIRYAPKELFVSVPLSRIDIQTACHRKDIPIGEWKTVDLGELDLEFVVRPENRPEPPIRMPVVGAVAEAGVEERNAVFRLCAYAHTPSGASLVNAQVTEAFRLADGKGGYMGPPVWTLDIERPVPLKGDIEVSGLPSVPKFRFDASDRERSKRIVRKGADSTPVSWDLTEAKRVRLPSEDLEVIQPKSPTPDEVAPAVAFKLRCKRKLPLGWQKLAANIDGERLFYWWGKGSLEENVVWEILFLPVGMGEHTITFSLPDFPDIAPVEFTIKNVLSAEARERWEEDLKKATLDRDQARAGAGSDPKALLKLLDEIEAEEQIAAATAQLRGTAAAKPSIKRCEALLLRFKQTYREPPDKWWEADDLDEDEATLHRRAANISWEEFYYPRLVMALFEGSGADACDAIRRYAEELHAKLAAGDPEEDEAFALLGFGLFAASCSGNRADARIHALHSLDLLPTEDRARLKKKILESPGGWVFDEP